MKKRILGAMFALFATGLFFAQDDIQFQKETCLLLCREM